MEASTEPFPDALLSMMSGGVPIPALAQSHPNITHALRLYDPVRTASTIGGLLTLPDLQCNCSRLEALVHLAVAFGRGKKTPPPATIEAWFTEMGQGPAGTLEDPAEDVFSSAVTSARGNFRVLEGIWESSTFYLQRLINVADRMPDEADLVSLRESMYAMLRLSDAVCERSALARHTIGTPTPRAALDRDVLRALEPLRRRLTFTHQELAELTGSPDGSLPFVFNPTFRERMGGETLLNSSLFAHPILRRSGTACLVLPTAVSYAIRSYLISQLLSLGYKDSLHRALADEYSQFFSESPPFRIGVRPPFAFRRTASCTLAECVKEVDSGRFLHVVLALDRLDNVEVTGIAGMQEGAALQSELSQCIERLRVHFSENAPQHDVITLVVICGIGRGFAIVPPSDLPPNWRLEAASAPDVSTLSQLSDVNTLTLWRILDAKQRLRDQGVRLGNINGLANLIALARSNHGHIVPQQLDDDQSETGKPNVLLIDPSHIHALRCEAVARIDRHVVQDPNGAWVEVRKPAGSLFEAEREQPLYASLQSTVPAIVPLVYEGQHHNWWCSIGTPHDYLRFQLVECWLPRFASVMDDEMKCLPAGTVDIVLRFAPALDEDLTPEGIATTSIGEILHGIAVTVDSDRRQIAVECDDAFERGLASAENISERALVTKLVEGTLSLAGRAASETGALVDRIVPNSTARASHVFTNPGFRHYVRSQLPDASIRVDPVDAATYGLGLSSHAGPTTPRIVGKQECTEFLNAVVRSLESELCQELARFDRRQLVEMALLNHESAMADADTWHRTSTAMLSLHGDEPGREAIALRRYENSVTQLCSRLVVEGALCEASPEGGCKPGRLDLARLMTRFSLIIDLGALSDLIYLDAIDPVVHISPFGDIQVEHPFFAQVMQPFGRAISNRAVDHSVESYSRHFEVRAVGTSADTAFEPAFREAWHDEWGCSIDRLRLFMDILDDHAIKKMTPVLGLKRSEVLTLMVAEVPEAAAILDRLTFLPRNGWHQIPDGCLVSDRFPWRFRRQLSLLRRPISQLDLTGDPQLVITPGHLRDAVAYLLGGYHQGEFPHRQLHSETMRQWAGNVARSRGRKFTSEVADGVAGAGWEVQTEVAVSTILGSKEYRQFGDIDVLAWHAVHGRVLLIECKDLHFHKTPGEIAEQLRDFRGVCHDGKPDLLLKHLRRLELLKSNCNRLAAFLRLHAQPSIEGWLIFRNPVPMLFAWQQIPGGVKVGTIDDVQSLLDTKRDGSTAAESPQE